MVIGGELGKDREGQQGFNPREGGAVLNCMRREQEIKSFLFVEFLHILVVANVARASY